MIDEDSSGTINFNEFLNLMYGKFSEKNDELRIVFQVFDQDNNGYITKDELRKAMEKLNYFVTDHELDELMREADLNKDGQVNYDGNYSKIKQSNLVQIFYF